MCGIAGYTGDLIPKLLDRMLDRLQHRGPDGRGDYHCPQVHLGMVRLSIIDLETGQQPMTNEDRTVWVLSNGEIYNYLELQAELQRTGHHFRTRSDTETIVHAYEEHGMDLAHKFNGMFAIAIWDEPRQRLTLIRDRFGVKPLFYSKTGNRLSFASEIKALQLMPGVDRSIDPAALSHYLSLRNVPAPFTIYRGIRALLPGHALTWQADGRTEVFRWYDLPMRTRWTEHDEPELVERIEEVLRDSVRLRMRADVTLGAYLSGGIDSSTVVGIMSEFSLRPVKTFTLSFSDSPAHKRDAEYAQMVAARYATEHHEYSMRPSDLEVELPLVIRHLDQPFGGVISSHWLTRYMQPRVKVALSGDGADDTFASYGHHRLVWPLAALREAQETGQPLESVDLQFFRDRPELVKEMAALTVPEWRLGWGAFMEHEKTDLLTEPARRWLADYPTPGFLASIYDRAAGVDDLNRLLYLDINTLLPNEILYFNDLLSMAHSIEVRTPFLDYRLVELACSIPGSLKLRDMTLKYILRKVAARYVPQEILDRPKEGFVLPNNTWLRQPLAHVVAERLASERLALHGYFKPGYVAGLVDRFLSGDESLTFRIWTLLVFQIWYERYALD